MQKRILAFLLTTLLALPALPVLADTPQAALARLLAQADDYEALVQNPSDIGAGRRQETAAQGQQPYAVIVTCSDSRVPPEHIFLGGIGELFVIRTAGHVVGPVELASIEYGVEHLGAQVVLVLGHSGCGAIAATLDAAAHDDAHAGGSLAALTDAIATNIPGITAAAEAEACHAAATAGALLQSEILFQLVEEDALVIAAALYDLETGGVTLIP